MLKETLQAQPSQSQEGSEQANINNLQNPESHSTEGLNELPLSDRLGKYYTYIISLSNETTNSLKTAFTKCISNEVWSTIMQIDVE